MNLAFEQYGSGHPIVLLHAFPLSDKMWSGNIKSLIELGFRLILPDLRGFGQSADFSSINSMKMMARDVNELLVFLQIEKAFIGGLSMGGYVTFDLYRLFPQKFAGLILCDTNAAADTVEKQESRYELIKKIEFHGIQALIENMLLNVIGGFTKTSNPELVSKIEKMFLQTEPKAAIAALRGMAERVDNTEILVKIDIPTIIIFGEQDKITNLQTAKLLHKQIKNSQFHTIKNAGHYSNLEQPEQFNLVLRNFIKEVGF